MTTTPAPASIPRPTNTLSPPFSVNLAITTAWQNTIGAGTDYLNGIENLTGSALSDTLIGSAANNTLSGLAGNDTLNGGAGADLMLGGSGHDLYVVDNAGDRRHSLNQNFCFIGSVRVSR